MRDIRERIRPGGVVDGSDLGETIGRLASPRMTGSAGARDVEQKLRERLESLGYIVREHPFSFSAWPGRFGLPVLGGAYLFGVILAAGLLLAGRPLGALITLVALAGLAGSMLLAARAAIRRLPWGRVGSNNWLAMRDGARPRYIVMAHRDTKSQPVSTYLRTAAILLAGIAWLALLVLAVAAFFGPATQWPALWLAAGVAAVIAGLVIAFSRAGNDSPGALDNASGLAALLELARRERDHDDLAFLVTDAEELGLAGAMAMSDELAPVFGIINLDGLDDEGEFRIVEQHGLPRRGLAPHLTAALLGAAGALGMPARRQDLPVGMMVDHIPFADAGFPAVTLMRGNAGSLRRVHRPSDTADRLTGSGAADAVALVGAALQLLREMELRH